MLDIIYVLSFLTVIAVQKSLPKDIFIKAQGLSITAAKMLHCIHGLTLRLIFVRNNNMVVAWATLCPQIVVDSLAGKLQAIF
jgi:hypothetical protein